jgi:hypothetical protein
MSSPVTAKNRACDVQLPKSQRTDANRSAANFDALAKQTGASDGSRDIDSRKPVSKVNSYHSALAQGLSNRWTLPVVPNVWTIEASSSLSRPKPSQNCGITRGWTPN